MPNFNELYPHPISEVDYPHGVFATSSLKPCAVCEDETAWVDLTFEANLCSSECQEIMWHGYMAASRASGFRYDPEYIKQEDESSGFREADDENFAKAVKLRDLLLEYVHHYEPWRQAQVWWAFSLLCGGCAVELGDKRWREAPLPVSTLHPRWWQFKLRRQQRENHKHYNVSSARSLIMDACVAMMWCFGRERNLLCNPGARWEIERVMELTRLDCEIHWAHGSLKTFADELLFGKP